MRLEHKFISHPVLVTTSELLRRLVSWHSVIEPVHKINISTEYIIIDYLQQPLTEQVTRTAGFHEGAKRVALPK